MKARDESSEHENGDGVRPVPAASVILVELPQVRLDLGAPIGAADGIEMQGVKPRPLADQHDRGPEQRIHAGARRRRGRLWGNARGARAASSAAASTNAVSV